MVYIPVEDSQRRSYGGRSYGGEEKEGKDEEEDLGLGVAAEPRSNLGIPVSSLGVMTQPFSRRNYGKRAPDEKRTVITRDDDTGTRTYVRMYGRTDGRTMELRTVRSEVP